MATSTSLMVPEQHLTRVRELNQMLQGAMNIASVPQAALLLGVLPIQAIIGIDMVIAQAANKP